MNDSFDGLLLVGTKSYSSAVLAHVPNYRASGELFLRLSCSSSQFLSVLCCLPAQIADGDGDVSNGGLLICRGKVMLIVLICRQN